MYAPKGVPREMIEQMRTAVARVQAMPDMEAFFAAQGASAMKAGPTELLAATREELARWAPIVRESGMKVD
jgi:tripartite-type tricarboxylate transporter receptor subunit TctC